MSTLDPARAAADRQRGRHGRLPDAALARDDDDVGGGAKLRNLHPRMLREADAIPPYVESAPLPLAALVLAALASWAGDAARRRGDAASVTRIGKRGIVVVQVNGLLDPLERGADQEVAARRRAGAGVAESCSSSTDPAQSTSTSTSLVRSDQRRRRCPSRCGSDRRAARRAAPARCSRWPAAYVVGRAGRAHRPDRSRRLR